MAHCRRCRPPQTSYSSPATHTPSVLVSTINAGRSCSTSRRGGGIEGGSRSGGGNGGGGGHELGGCGGESRSREEQVRERVANAIQRLVGQVLSLLALPSTIVQILTPEELRARRGRIWPWPAMRWRLSQVCWRAFRRTHARPSSADSGSMHTCQLEASQTKTKKRGEKKSVSHAILSKADELPVYEALSYYYMRP